jgi:ABC-type multidrug transport system permease subunit
MARRLDAEAAALRLRTGKTELVVIPPAGGEGSYEYLYDPTRAESLLARNAVDDVLQRAAGRQDKYQPSERQMLEPGGRYIDFLVPGLLGMSLMGGGLWGVGFVIVDMRIRKLLKRFLATPMKKRDFLAGIMLSRLVFLAPDVLFLLVFAWLVFGVVIQGSLLAIVFLVLLGAFTFSGIGLLVASRAKTVEGVSGMMNVVMLPQWVLSGIFFSSERFPEAAQPYLKFIPLTPLNDALRAVMLEGKPLASQFLEIGILAAWGVVTFALALRWFRWT